MEQDDATPNYDKSNRALADFLSKYGSLHPDITEDAFSLLATEREDFCARTVHRTEERFDGAIKIAFVVTSITVLIIVVYLLLANFL